jgi:hypothetical protein
LGSDRPTKRTWRDRHVLKALARTALSTAKHGTHVARDPHPASARVQKAVDRRAKAATRETATIKAKRPAS